ncbi:hypothetical protein Ocin01_12415 [Orchesella cincta]|uniref:Uncharacterized protein n=1 Tax=Orchesella cincta TaxID=48709 RepID=A0A1D2MML6_ORCCI|nr:hypothetical protein Ocin01_12415 [Orchesella cincta]
MEQTVAFFVVFTLFYAVLLVSSRVVPEKQILSEVDRSADLSQVLGLHQGDDSIYYDDLQHRQTETNDVAPKRVRRWAIPADVQDTLCANGKIRRIDGKCISVGNGEDEYDTAP